MHYEVEGINYLKVVIIADISTNWQFLTNKNYIYEQISTKTVFYSGWFNDVFLEPYMYMSQTNSWEV